MTQLTKEDIKCGSVYRAKRPTLNIFGAVHNDRQVIWMDSFKSQCQYDSDTVAAGRRFPKVDMDNFLRWVDRELTEQEYIDEGYRKA